MMLQLNCIYVKVIRAALAIVVILLALEINSCPMNLSNLMLNLNVLLLIIINS